VVRRDWLKMGPKDDVFCPRHIFRAPDGRLLFERVTVVDAEELVRLVERAVAYSTPEALAIYDTVPGRLKRASDLIPCIRQAALAELLAPKDPAVDAQVFDLVRKTEIDAIADDALRALGASMTPTRAEQMRKLLAAPGHRTRMHATAALCREKGKESFDAIAAALAKEKRPDVAAVMVRALPLCGGDAAKARDLVLKHAKSGEDEVRVSAIAALAPWASEDAVVDAVRKLPNNEKAPEKLRIAALWLLGNSGRKEIADEWKPIAESKSDTLKRMAQAAAAKLGGAPPDRYDQWIWWFAPLPVALQ
jgi:hypothetical protein